MARAKKNFDTLMEELEQIVLELEQGTLTLEETLKRYAAGVELVAACREKLDAAANTLHKTEQEVVHDSVE